MHATVFVWYPSPHGIGHASLGVLNGPYISWWPSGFVPGEKKGQTVSRPIAQDKNLEGGIPDYASPPIVDLDFGKIATWWSKYSGRAPGEVQSARNKPVIVATGNKWDMYAANCANAVLQALLAGGAGSNARVQALLSGREQISPILIREIAEALAGVGGSNDLDTKLSVLPAEIGHYGSYIAKKILGK